MRAIFKSSVLAYVFAIALTQGAVLVEPLDEPSNIAYPLLFPFSFGVNASSLFLFHQLSSSVQPGSLHSVGVENTAGMPGDNQVRSVHAKRGPKPSGTGPDNLSATPAPTGQSSPSTMVHITDEHDFALLLPGNPGELVSDAESDGVAFCTRSGTNSACSRRMADGFIRAAAVTHATDGSYVQVTGCLDTSKSSLSASDDGGQFDVRFPNGAQCTFGGYAASFIEQVEPSASRFCLRCCAAPNDQQNCNSHRDTAGCVVAVPGIYDFPDLGVSCE